MPGKDRQKIGTHGPQRASNAQDDDSGGATVSRNKLSKSHKKGSDKDRKSPGTGRSNDAEPAKESDEFQGVGPALTAEAVKDSKK